MVITSTTNENIKNLRALYRDKKLRYERGEFVAEGAVLVKDVPPALIKRIFLRESDGDKYAYLASDKPCFRVKDGIFDAVADAKAPSGIIAVCSIPEEKPVEGELCLLLCGVSDAGNVGAIIRTACARGIHSVICADTADPFSPKAVRSAMSASVKVNVVRTGCKEAAALLTGYRMAALDMKGISIYSYKNMGKTALAVGNEAHGLPEEILSCAAIRLSIPMKENGVESLNAAVAAGIAMYLI